tara:strand:- start:249 stop:446 length:198 start_codon:yes stop_codon:yes gene_type:complete
MLNKPMVKKCTQCQIDLDEKVFYEPMSEWKIEGPLCSVCYSEQIKKFYPGQHVRLNLEEGEEEKI